jgi:hypothetical protein
MSVREISFREAPIYSLHPIWWPFSRLAALSNGSISPASPTVTRLARHENDSPSGVQAINRHFPSLKALVALFVVLVAVVLCATAPQYAHAAKSAQIEVGDAGQVKRGEEFSVPVSIQGNPGIAGASFVFQYDAGQLELTGFDSEGDIFADGLIENPTANIVGYLTFPNDKKEDGVLFNVRFKVRENAEPGNCDISISPKDGHATNLVNAKAEAVPVTFSAGSVTIAGAASGEVSTPDKGADAAVEIDAHNPNLTEPKQIAPGDTFFVKAEEGSLSWDTAMLDGRYDPDVEGYVFSARDSGQTTIEYEGENGERAAIPIEIGDKDATFAGGETENTSSAVSSHPQNLNSNTILIMAIVAATAITATLVVSVIRRWKKKKST